jgi:hypothetical protein
MKVAPLLHIDNIEVIYENVILAVKNITLSVGHLNKENLLKA